MGACVGSLVAGAWAALDWANLAYAEWSGLAAVVGAGALLGMLGGFFGRISKKALADSIDRRANLEDRLTTSLERSSYGSGFDEALHQDAREKVENLKPAQLYPVKVGKWHAGAIVLAALASSIFLLGNTPIFLNDQQRHDRQELKEAGKAVERVMKPMEHDMHEASQNPDEKRLAEEMRRLARDMQRAKISKEEALQKANELQKQAEKLVRDKGNMMAQNLSEAESAFEKLQKAELEKMGFKDPNLAKMDPKLAQMSDAERQSQMQSLQKESQNLEGEMQRLQQQLQKSGLSKEESDALKSKLQDLQSKLSSNKSMQEQLKLSQAVKDMLKRMMDNPVMKEIMEMQKKLQEAAKDAQEQGEQQKLTHEQLEEMQKRLEELANQLKDDAAMTEYLKKLLDSMKNACGT